VNFIQQEQQCKFLSFTFYNLISYFVFRNNQVFHAIFASAMRQDYTVTPSMIGGQDGIIWSYDNAKAVRGFSGAAPLDVSSAKCDNLTVCLWYVSPLVQFSDSPKAQYALLGEWNKWTAVSQQRFISIETDRQNSRATITVQGLFGETVPVVIYHTTLLSVTVSCRISAVNGQAKVDITISNVVCS
jgi:hypothetical protein